MTASFVCIACGVVSACKPSHVPLKKYCSRACMSGGYQQRMMGAANPNYREAGRKQCSQCGKTFQSYNKTRKTCSLRCRSLSPENIERLKWMARRPKPSNRKRSGLGSRDANHGVIVEAFIAAGATVFDLSDVGGGCPDILIGYAGINQTVEIKNPATKYGKRGLNDNQIRWHEGWRGARPAIVRLVSEVPAVLEAMRRESVNP